MEYIAHITEDRVRKQAVEEHLRAVAELSREFAVDSFKNLAYVCGLGHDIGKYDDKFQQRIRGNNSIRVQHSLGGAKEIIEINSSNLAAYMAAFCIIGHHTGLPDGGSDVDGEEDSSLLGRLKNKVDYKEYRAFLKEEELRLDTGFFDLFRSLCKTKEDIFEVSAFVTRYIFSCLTDGDFIDTERFFEGNIRKPLSVDFDSCLKSLKDFTGGFVADTPIKKARNSLLAEALEGIKEDSEIYLMNMPTGSGKTLSSARVALERISLLKGTPKEKRRIIYVIPYTSIIEQTAEIFEGIFKGQAILQHHSNYYYELKDKNNEDNFITEKLIKLASENWDADFIITTDVQFFESLFNCKSSRLRKLHNMADSIIIFDEIHTMPKKYLEPCIRGVGYIAKLLNSEIIFMTATMPSFNEFFEEFIPFCRVKNLVSDRYNEAFKKCGYKYIGETDNEGLLTKTEDNLSTLIVVNTRTRARELYELFKSAYGEEIVYHLSTYMTCYDRSNTLNTIRERLKNKEKVYIISTSLIEAGVDIDCFSAYRELTGLDSILQTGGRCNREGLYKNCVVNVFSFNDNKRVNEEIKLKANITKGLFKEYENITSRECIEEYYKRYYEDTATLKLQSISAITESNVFKYTKFRTYSNEFKMIDTKTLAVIIQRDEFSAKKINELKFGSKAALKALRRYSATLYMYEFEKLLEMGVVDDFGTGEYVLTNSDYYDPKIGLKFGNIDYYA